MFLVPGFVPSGPPPRALERSVSDLSQVQTQLLESKIGMAFVEARMAYRQGHVMHHSTSADFSVRIRC